MKLSTQTILILGLVQCVVLTLILVLFFRYQRSLGSGAEANPSVESSLETER